jgi:hypothetical protein
MGGQLLVLGRLFPIPLVSLLVLSTHLLWAQNTQPLEESPVRLFGRAVQLAPVPEAKIHLRPVSGQLPPSFEANQGQTESQVRFLPRPTGYYHVPINNKAALELHQPTGTAALLGKANFIGSAPSKWLTFSPTYGKLHYRTIHRADDLEYYGHHTPLAGSIILRIRQQAKAHPHAARALSYLKPQF